MSQHQQTTTEGESAQVEPDVDAKPLAEEGRAGSLMASLWQLQDQLTTDEAEPEVDFQMPWEQRLAVERRGVRYCVEQVSRRADGGHGYAIGAELPTTDNFGRERTKVLTSNVINLVPTWPEAVNLLWQVVCADPRQPDLTAWNEKPKNITVTVK
ncbi:MAG: hypothetical protein ACI9CA_000007 [Natronomonas sp.]|jgi:hypothetical protein